MKSILFIMRYPLGANHHLKQKFDGQMQACVNLGYQVYHFGYDKDIVYLVNYNNKTQQPIQKTHFGAYGNYRSTFGFIDLFLALNKVAKTRSFDYAYMRSKTVNHTAVNAVKALKTHNCRFIIEIPSYMSDEEVLGFKRKAVMAVAKRWGQQLNEITDLYALIGPDSGGYYHGRPAISIENGINLDTIPIRKHIQQKELHILALASMRKWHAYDRLLKGLAAYKGNENIVIDMVGGDNDGSLEEWKNLVDDSHIDDKVIFHGPKFGDDLNRMFEISDAGVATLGLHRNGLTEGSVLKAREYMARGLPFIYGYKDVSIEDDFPYTLRVPANENPVDFDLVVDWLKKVNSDENVSQKMREYAKKHMSWETTFQAIIQIVDSLY